jgi:signal transduction histidine kinase
LFFLRSVKNWLTLLFVAIAGLASLVVWLYVVPSLDSRLVSQKLVDMRANVDLISSAIYQVMGETQVGQTRQIEIPYPNELARFVGQTGQKMNARVVVVQASNLVKVPNADSRPQVVFKASDYPMLATAISTGSVEQGTVTIADEKYAVTAVPLPSRIDPTQYMAVVLVAASLHDVEASVSAVERQILRASALAIAVSLLIGYLAAYFISRRIRRVELSAEAIAGGDFASSVKVGLRDEIGELGLTFNDMGAKLADAFSQVELEKNRVELLLNDLSEGVIGISGDGRVSITNPAAARLLGQRLQPDAELGRAFPYEVARMWYESRRDGRHQDVVFVHGPRTLEASTYPVGSGADFNSIVVLRDVTAQAKLDRARRDFVANASHEFKTPLFSLSGFLELLDEGDLESGEQHEFLQLMKQQVDRLRDLSLSLLDLSRVEAGAIELEADEVDLGDLAASVVSEFQTQTAARRIDLSVTPPPQPEIAYCDEQRTAQVVRALIDNAVKFSPEGGSVRVEIGGDGNQRFATLAVADDGPGIPKPELPHIFDRFYRGSEDRGNKAGAGLGLSIARELIELMGGTISAHSKVGEGSTFAIRLPREPVKKA